MRGGRKVESPLMPETASPPAPRPLFAALGRLLETALNRVVDLDADTRARLRALDD